MENQGKLGQFRRFAARLKGRKTPSMTTTPTLGLGSQTCRVVNKDYSDRQRVQIKYEEAANELKEASKIHSDSQEDAVPSSVVGATSSKNIAGTSVTAGDVSQSVQTSHLLANVEPQSHDQVTSSIAQSASSVQQPTTAVSAVPPSISLGTGDMSEATTPSTTQFTRESEVAKAYENQYTTAGYYEILGYVNAYQPQEPLPPLQWYGMPMQTQQGGSGQPMPSVYQTAPYGSFPNPYYGSGT